MVDRFGDRFTNGVGKTLASLGRVQGSSPCLCLEDDLCQHSTRDVMENRVEWAVIEGKTDAEEVREIGADGTAFLPEGV